MSAASLSKGAKAVKVAKAKVVAAVAGAKVRVFPQHWQAQGVVFQWEVTRPGVNLPTLSSWEKPMN